MKYFRFWAGRARPFGAGMLVLLLSACASTSSWEVQRNIRNDTGAWLLQNIMPILDTQPGKAAELIEARLNRLCPVGDKLGSDHFYALLKDTDYQNNTDACDDLAVIAVYAYFKQGNLANKQNYYQQFWYNNALQNNPRGWSGYVYMDCGTFDIQWAVRRRFSNIAAISSEYSMRYRDRFKLPGWLEMDRIVGDHRTERGDFIYKNHLCQLDKNFDKRLEPDLKAAFVADSTRLYGEQAANDVRKYLDQIYTPLKQASLKLLDNKDPALYRAKVVVLYENALHHLSALGLDKVVYNDKAVFREHLQTELNNARKSLRLFL